MSDDLESDFIIATNTRRSLSELETFLKSRNYETPKRCPYTNVIDQRSGKTYCIPYNTKLSRIRPVPIPIETKKDEAKDKWSFSESSGSQTNLFIDPSESKTPLEEFFLRLEACRLDGITTCFSERQYFTVPFTGNNFPSEFSTVVEDDDVGDAITFGDSDDDGEWDTPPMESPSPQVEAEIGGFTGEAEKGISIDTTRDIEVEKSCIEFDFDIYVKEKITLRSDTFFGIIGRVAVLTEEILDWGEHKDLVIAFHTALLRKPQRLITDPEDSAFKKYGNVWKESFHLRFYMKVSKEVKIYMRKRLLADPAFQDIFSRMNMVNHLEDAFDKNIMANPIMFLGNMKKTGNRPHEMEALFHVGYHPIQRIPLIQPQDEFRLVDKPPTPVYDGAGRKRGMTQIERFCRYNLCFELSLTFEVPGGLIKKFEFEPKSSKRAEIETYGERAESGYVPDSSLDEVENQVTTITTQDFDAAYIQKILDIIGRHRAIDYANWKTVVIALARKSKEYKPLAIWFSLRYAQSFMKDGLKQLNSIWAWALERRPSTDQDHISIASIYNWAKVDDINAYNDVQQHNVFMKLKKRLVGQQGLLNDVDFATVLRDMFSHTFRCDENRVALGKGSATLVWREFVYEDTDQKPGELYKWRKQSHLWTLQEYISKKLPNYLETILKWFTQKQETIKSESETTPQAIPGGGGTVSPVQQAEQKTRDLKYYELVAKGIRKTKFSLGKKATLSSIMWACEAEFIRGNRGFEAKMDMNPDVIGVQNGVLRLRPKTFLIQTYHEIPISKSTNVSYIPYDSNNLFVKELETVYREIFNNNEQTYRFWMMLLSSGLDDRSKTPQYFVIGHGGGSQGKSVLHEMELNTMGIGLPGGEGGYAMKMDNGWFCQDRKSTGPDSALASTKKMRKIWTSESKVEANFHLDKIKEILSDHVSGNDKNEKQDVWKVNAHIVCPTNHKPRISGRDYGTMRRILYYRFKKYFKRETGPAFDRYNSADPTHALARPEIVDEWVKDPNYQTAYFSILVHFYEILRDEYRGDIRRVPKDEIDRETEQFFVEQDTLTQFIHERVILIGETYPESEEKVEYVHITEIMQKYIKWHNTVISGTAKFDRQELQEAILTHFKLDKYFTQAVGGDYLQFHKVLDLNEVYARILKPIGSSQNLNVKVQMAQELASDLLEHQEMFDDLDLTDASKISPKISPKISVTTTLDITVVNHEKHDNVEVMIPDELDDDLDG